MPGIGFDLTPSYGTAAIRYHNWSIVALARSDEGLEYESLMMRFSSKSSRRPSPRSPASIWDELKYMLYRAKRRANKLAGRPATPDVGTLSQLMERLRRLTGYSLGYSIASAMVAAPDLPGLYQEDLKLYNLFGHLSETSTAWAGSGLGMRSNCTDIYECEDEELQFAAYQTLVLYFSQRAFGASVLNMEVAYTDLVQASLIDWDAGPNSLQHHPSAASYWDHIRTKVQELPRQTRRPIEMLVLHGEEAHNERFLAVVRDALRETQGPRVHQVVLSVSSNRSWAQTGKIRCLSWLKERLSSPNAHRKRRGTARSLRAVGNADGSLGG